jgi:hypothetical protein
MYLDVGTIIAICIALVAQMITIVLLIKSAYNWERHYRDVVRLLKIEKTHR